MDQEMLQNVNNAINTGADYHGNNDPKCEEGRRKKIEGTAVLMKKNVLDFNDLNASDLDNLHELLGQKVSLQLISAVNGDPGN